MNRNGRGGRAAPNGYKILSIFLAAVLVIAAITELILWQMDYIVFQNPKEATEQEDGGAPIDENGEELPTGGEVAAMPKAMTFRSATALDCETEYDAVTLTATVLPENASDKRVDWTIRFKNASSEWASGKTVTDYVTVTPESDGANKATVQCLQDFGEQIEVVATSRDNASAYAVCTVDFAKRIEDVIFYDHYGSINGTSASSGNPISWPFGLDFNSYEIYFEAQFSDYTVDDFDVIGDSSSYVRCMISFNESLGVSGTLTLESGARVGFNQSLFCRWGQENATTWNLKNELNGGNPATAFPEDEFKTWAYDKRDESGYIDLFTFTINLDGEYTDYSCEWTVRFSASYFRVSAQSIDLDQTETTI